MLIYLGYIISSNQVKMDLVKLKGIVDWKTPSNVKKVRRFMKFYNFYWKIIKNYTKISASIQ